MLILSRKFQESVTIIVPASSVPTTVVVSVGAIHEAKVSLGIAAEKHVKIDRTEIASKLPMVAQ